MGSRTHTSLQAAGPGNLEFSSHYAWESAGRSPDDRPYMVWRQKVSRRVGWILRIHYFVGSERAAQRLINQYEFQSAKVVKVNPDSPQAHVRRGVLFGGKLLIMPSPRLRREFILLNPKRIPKRFLMKASTIRGAFKYGRFCSFEELPKVDLIVAGSVAVSRDGWGSVRVEDTAR